MANRPQKNKNKMGVEVPHFTMVTVNFVEKTNHIFINILIRNLLIESGTCGGSIRNCSNWLPEIHRFTSYIHT